MDTREKFFVDIISDYKTLRASISFKKKEKLLKFSGDYCERESLSCLKYPLQITETTFLVSSIDIDNYINHSCEPNCSIDFKSMNLVALRDIAPGEEVSFNYCTTEYDLVDQGGQFFCGCGKISCVGEVRGFRYLSIEQKKGLKKYISPYLAGVLQSELQQVRQQALAMDALKYRPHKGAALVGHMARA